jgi:hypothetical protein
MPKSRVAKSRMFREASPMKKKYLSHGGLKNTYLVFRDWEVRHNLSAANIMIMLYVYDLEFFTIRYICGKLDRNEAAFKRDNLRPLQNDGFVYKHFDKLSPSQTREDHVFREENKWNYRVRYALTQKGRNMVARFYRMAAGEPIDDPI